jgi:hypothetical protein
MNANEIFDYSFGQLEGRAREQADAAVAADPVTAETAERLTRAVHRLLDDGQMYEPPIGLASRTVQFVAEASQKRQRRTILEFRPVTVPFRLADVAVAACILFAGLLTLLPAVQRSRERMNVAGCGYNLQQLGRALWQYGSTHHHYPFGPEQNPRAPAGAFLALLHDGGLISDAQLAQLDCPNLGHGHLGRKHVPLPDFQTICRLHSTDTSRVRDLICLSYSYNVGYHANPGRVVPIVAVRSASIPLLADDPPHEDFRRIQSGNSPNHGGLGQNVLYSDLHVGWHTSRRIGPRDDDIYLNDNEQLAPGVDADDHVLLPSLVPALGW